MDAVTSPTKTPTTIQHSINSFTGHNAPQTGEYYKHIYSGIDGDTGVNTLDVELHRQYLPNSPTPLNNVSDNQLDIVRVPKTSTSTLTVTKHKQSDGGLVVKHDTPNTYDQHGGGLPLVGSVILMILLALVWFVYKIIRIWQDTQARKMILNTEPVIKEEMVVNSDTQGNTGNQVQHGDNLDWRDTIQQYVQKLDNILTQKGIQGDDISDKLKNVSSGQLKSADIAWEAYQSAKQLLNTHSADVDEHSIKRTLKLFETAFADNGTL